MRKDRREHESKPRGQRVLQTPAGLIAELDRLSPEYQRACIVVVFEHRTGLIFADELGREQKLIEFAAAGGRPVGWVGITNKPGNFSVDGCVFPDYAQRVWAMAGLREVARGFREAFEEKLKRVGD